MCLNKNRWLNSLTKKNEQSKITFKCIQIKWIKCIMIYECILNILLTNIILEIYQ